MDPQERLKRAWERAEGDKVCVTPRCVNELGTRWRTRFVFVQPVYNVTFGFFLAKQAIRVVGL